LHRSHLYEISLNDIKFVLWSVSFAYLLDRELRRSDKFGLGSCIDLRNQLCIFFERDDIAVLDCACLYTLTLVLYIEASIEIYHLRYVTRLNGIAGIHYQSFVFCIFICKEVDSIERKQKEHDDDAVGE